MGLHISKNPFLKKQLCCGCLVLLLVPVLTGCGGEATTAPTTALSTQATEDPGLQATHLQMVVTYENVGSLENYPNLESLDATGSTCYPALEVYARNHPEVTVSYTVSLGTMEVPHGLEQIDLSPGEADYEALMTNLQYLKDTKRLVLPKTNLTAEELENLQEKYPDLEISYTLGLAGKEYDAGTTSVDLSALEPGDVLAAAETLGRMPLLETVELMSGGSSALSLSDVEVLVNAAPQASFHYSFTLFGKTISTNDTQVEFRNLSLTEADEPALRAALAVMTDCNAFILDNCGLSNEKMAEIRADYPRTELVWRISFGKYSAMTNQETIRAVYNVFDDTCENLKYCWRTKYMDIGHNDTLTDLSFVGYMPDLEILIASGSAVKELQGFENCKKLEFLELANCYKLESIDNLAGCENLKHLNICYSKVSSLKALDGLPLEQFMCKQTRVPAAEQKVFKEIHPNCITNFYGKEPYAGAGWRYVDNGKTYTEIYKKVREVFKYDDMPMPVIEKDK